MVNTIGTEPNAPLYYAPASEHHRLTMSKIGVCGGQLEIERESQHWGGNSKFSLKVIAVEYFTNSVDLGSNEIIIILSFIYK